MKFIYVACLFLALYFNAYKFELMRIVPYHIFPWSSFPQTAKSSPDSLQFHAYTALILLLAVTIRIYYPYASNSMGFWTVMHYIFMTVILLNIVNLGNFSSLMAAAINGSMLLTLEIFLSYDLPQLYYWTLYSPVAFEVISYVGNQIKAH